MIYGLPYILQKERPALKMIGPYEKLLHKAMFGWKKRELYLAPIRPFLHGNGRQARLMADLFLEKIFTTEVFSRGGESLVNHNETSQVRFQREMETASLMVFSSGKGTG